MSRRLAEMVQYATLLHLRLKTNTRSNPIFLTFSWRRLVSPQPAELPRRHRGMPAMAKANMIKIKLLSSADTGYFYVTKKNSRTQTEKLVKKKYDPVAKKHVEFREGKIK